MKRFEQALESNVDLPTNQAELDQLTVKATPTDEEKKKINNAKAKETAVAQLTMSLETTDLLKHLQDSKTNEWKHGLAWMIMKSLANE